MDAPVIPEVVQRKGVTPGSQLQVPFRHQVLLVLLRVEHKVLVSVLLPEPRRAPTQDPAITKVNGQGIFRDNGLETFRGNSAKVIFQDSNGRGIFRGNNARALPTSEPGSNRNAAWAGGQALGVVPADLPDHQRVLPNPS